MGKPWQKKVFLWSWNVFVLIGLIIIACDRHSLRPADISLKSGEATQAKKLTLALFGVPNSPDTQSLLPVLQSELDKLPEQDRLAVDQVLYLTGSGNPSEPATDELAEQYRQFLGLKGRAQADEQTKNFKQLVGGTLNLPAAAVVDLDGTVLKAFRAGPTTFVPSEISGFSRDSLRRYKSVTLALFGAPWCTECKTEMPAIQDALDLAVKNFTLTQKAYIDVKMYVTTSGNPAEPPTAEVAQQYMESVHVKGKAIADEWRWKNFRAMVGGSLVLPGAAIIVDGKVTKSFRAGPTTFVPNEIVNFSVESIE